MRPDHWWTDSDGDDEWPGSAGRNLSRPWPKISRLGDGLGDSGAASSRDAGGHGRAPAGHGEPDTRRVVGGPTATTSIEGGSPRIQSRGPPLYQDAAIHCAPLSPCPPAENLPDPMLHEANMVAVVTSVTGGQAALGHQASEGSPILDLFPLEDPPTRPDRTVDPMAEEVVTQPIEHITTWPAQSAVLASTAFGRILVSLGHQSTSGPSLECVRFPEVESGTLLPQSNTPPEYPALGVADGSPTAFVNTRRGSHTNDMTAGCIPTSPSGFGEAVAAPVPQAICSTPCRRRARHPAPPRPPRHSTRLAKKARSRTPALVAAQNVLLKKLNITHDAPPEAADIETYIDIFQRGLSEEQARLIGELFVDYVPAAAEQEVKDGAA